MGSRAGNRSGVDDGGPRLAAHPSRRLLGTWLTLLGMFVLIAASVELHWWRELDGSVNEWAATQRGTLVWHASKVVFDFAAPGIALSITLALALLVAWRRRRWGIAVEAAIRVGMVVATVLLLKPLLAVPGPTQDPLGDHGGSFPSGHTTSAMVCVALLLGWIGRPRSMTGRALVATGVATVVGGAVIYVRYHYVSDVVGGIALGLLIVALPYRLVGNPTHRRRPLPPLSAGPPDAEP